MAQDFGSRYAAASGRRHGMKRKASSERATKRAKCKPHKSPYAIARNRQLAAYARQKNSCDSGLYVLRYAQEFLARAVCGGAALRVRDYPAWFAGGDIAEERRDIKKLAADLELEKIRAAYRREQAEDAAAPPAGAAPP